MFRLMGFLLILSAIGGTIFAGKTYLENMQTDLDILNRNAAQYELVVEQKDAVIVQLEANAKENAEAQIELQEKLQESEAYRTQLINKLQKHDLTNLSMKKPGLVEKRINDGTKKLFDDIESITAK